MHVNFKFGQGSMMFDRAMPHELIKKKWNFQFPSSKFERMYKISTLKLRIQIFYQKFISSLMNFDRVMPVEHRQKRTNLLCKQM